MAHNIKENSIFRFILQRFKTQQHVVNIQRCVCCLKTNCFALLSSEKRLIIGQLCKSNTEVETKCELDLENVESFAFQDEPDDLSRSQIAVITSSELELTIYEDSAESFMSTQKADIKSELIKTLDLQDVTSAQLVLFKGDFVTVCVNKAFIVKFSIKDGQCKSIYRIALPESINNFQNFKIVDDTCIILDADQLSFYSIEDGEAWSNVDLKPTSLNITSVQAWAVTDNLKYMIVVLQSGDIHVIDLQAYCTAFGVLKHKQKSRQRGQLLHSNFHTTQYGDIPWRDKLLFLHSELESYQRQKSSTGTLKRTYQERNIFGSTNQPKVTGFKTKSKERSTSVVKVIKAPDDAQGFKVDNISLDQGEVTVVYSDNDTQVLCQVAMETQTWNTLRLERGEVLVLSTDASLPHVIVSEKLLEGLIISPGMDQEKFVNELMVYGGVVLADTVCHLNNWGRSSMPIHTLQVGLKHRQLDTVAFFLKSKEKLFSTTHASLQKSNQDPPSEAPQFSHLDSLIQLEPAVNILLECVRGAIGDKHSQIFGKQVLDTSLDFLYELLLNSLSVSEFVVTEDERSDLQQATDKLLQYIEMTRDCIHSLEQKRVSVSRSESAAGSTTSGTSPSDSNIKTPALLDSPDGPSQVSQWDSMDLETVIEDGIMKNMVPDLQQYLLQNREHSRADYSEISSTCVALATNYIKYGKMDKAKEMLTKLGLSFSDELWKIALYSLDITLCTSIIEELLRISALTKEQVAMVTFFKELNELYPCRDFEGIQKSHHHVKDGDSHEVQRLKNLIQQTAEYDLTESCGNLTYHAQEEVGTSHYNEVMLDWVQHWDRGTRDLIKLDVLLHKSGSDITGFSKEVVWEYLLSRNMADVVVAWIHNSFLSNQQDLSDQQEVGWPVSQLGKIMPDFVNEISHCTHRTEKKILNAFARHGIFRKEDLSNFQALLKQVCRIGGPLKLPHPLVQSQSGALAQFHSDMVQYCIHHNLQYFLWQYIHCHSLEIDWLMSVCEGHTDCSWLPLFMKFLAIATADRSSMRSVMYEGSLMNAFTVWDSESVSVGELLQTGHTLAALATLMYSQHKLQQVTFVTQQLEAFDGLSSETVERALQGYRKLQVTLFPASATDSTHTDVSVYQLLFGNAPFDPAKLFGWQTTNTCAGEDAMKEMPYFSHAGLIAKYGYSEHLRYTYYLKQARPSFAFITFLAEELKNGGTLSSKRLSVAIGTSIWIGVKHFHNPQISSSSVLFQELLGHDSTILRLYIQIGNEVLAYRNQAVTGSMDQRREQVKKNEQEVVEMLLDCIQNGGRCATVVLGALEAAILAAVTREKLKLYSFEASQHWTVAIMFCDLHNLPYTTVFLESCAESKQWLPFIWFSQIHQYPKEQLQNLLHKFQSSNLQEHLRYVLVNAEMRTTQAEEKKVQAKHRSERVAKDVRSNLYSRIGLVKGADSEASSTSDDDEIQAHLSGNAAEQDHLDVDTGLELTYDSASGDVFGVVFAAQSSKSPWKSLLLHSITLRNCLFAELAASFSGATVLSCLCSWLIAMMDVTEHAQFLENHGKSPWRYTMATLDTILDVFIQNKWGSLLVTGFDIFQQNSPLLPFLQFYAECTEKQNYKNCRLLLDEFKESVFQFNHEKSVQVAEYIGDGSWLEQTTYRIIQYMLTSTSSVHSVAQLLKLLDSESITLVFKNVDPDFRRQSQLLQCIEEGEIQNVNFSALLGQSSDLFENECLSVLEQLMNKQLYREARKFARIAGICADNVTLNQVMEEKSRICSTDLWQSRQARFKFYKDCALKFNKHKIPLQKITNFFKNEVKGLSCLDEKGDVYEICMRCMEMQADADDDAGCWAEIYRNMWLCRIQAHLENTQSLMVAESKFDLFTDTKSKEALHSVKTELMFCGKMPHSSDHPENMAENEVKVVHQLAGDLLKNGHVSESCRLLVEFNVYSQDLAIILTCIRLSMGSLSLDTMSPDMLHLLRSRPGSMHRQSIAAPVALLRNSSTISLMSNIQPVIDSVSVENEAKISAMECLLNHLNDGRPTCIRIITAFKIAAVLYIGYDDVITGDDYFILKSLLKTNCSAKFRLAADFLGTSSLSSEQVAGFLSDAIIQSYRVSLGETARDQELFFDFSENFSDFHQVVRLCHEPSLLGNRLLDSVASMSGDLEQTNDKALTLQTELLILAHECYTASCDMEGISNILRAARILTAHLQAAGEHQLMTRLLTGVGRYNEMTYIFDALQQNHQFELLLGKGKERETKLKTAILDYLKRYHPEDTDTYTMVALKFMMYREIAQLLEDSANKHLKKLERKPLENTSETQALLQKVAQFLSEAAESYIKDNCLRHAQVCVRKARLVALQIKYLPSNQQFINLTTKGANLLIADHPVFTEAYIISEAYKQKENWALALCNNVIKLGNMKYLQELRSHIKLTPSLIEDAVDRFQQCADKPIQALGHIKKLLQYCKDIKIQYRLAKQLGLRDLVINLEKGDAKSFIMDFASVTS